MASAAKKKEAVEETVEEETKAVAVAESTDVALSEDDLADMYENAGQGTEDITSEHMEIPFIKVIQSNSAEATKGGGDYIPGCEAGNIFNKGTGQILEGESGLFFVPVKFTEQYTEWVPLEKGGGFKGTHDPSIKNTATEQEDGSLKLPNGNDLVIYTNWFGLEVNFDDLSIEPGLMALKSSNQRSGKVMNTAVKRLKRTAMIDGKEIIFTPPAWESCFAVTTKFRQNEKGSWHVFNFSRVGYVRELYEGVFGRMIISAAKEMYESIQSGLIKTDVNVEAAEETGKAASNAPGEEQF